MARPQPTRGFYVTWNLCFARRAHLRHSPRIRITITGLRPFLKKPESIGSTSGNFIESLAKVLGVGNRIVIRGNGVKCKSCKAEFPGTLWLRIRFREVTCPRCEERHTTSRQLRLEAAILTASAVMMAMLSVVYERGYFWLAFAVFLAALVWTEYAVITKRRRGLASASIPR